MKKHEPMTEERLLAIKMREAKATPGNPGKSGNVPESEQGE